VLDGCHLAACVSASAADTYQLAIKGERQDSKIHHRSRGTVNFNLDGLPSELEISGENLAAKMTVDTYWTRSTRKMTDDVSHKNEMNNVTLGIFCNCRTSALGLGMGKAPDLQIELTPQAESAASRSTISISQSRRGGGRGRRNENPGLDSLGLNASSMGTILPIITG